MQTRVPTLPIVYSKEDKYLTRKVNRGVIRTSPTESKNYSQSNNTTPFLVFNRKQLNPILGGPYKDSMWLHCQSEPVRMTKTCNNLMGQRIISAKVLRMKELQNQLTDAHYHLNELANENRLLKALQKRQDSALKRYEGTNAELPRIINSHQEELKALQTNYKQLKLQHKHTCVLLKAKESEIHYLQTQNKHLLKLSKDQQLGEREKLQIQVSDLNHEIQQQHKTIQTLNRKLTLENKKFKHQINIEVTKHKETRKQLHISLEKLKTLEDLLNNREKRLYSKPNGHQLPSFSQRKSMTCQSLTNLENNSKCHNSQVDAKNKTLPKINVKKSNDIGKSSATKTINSLDIVKSSESITCVNHVQKFQLQKSAESHHSSSYSSDECNRRNKTEVETDTATKSCKKNLNFQSSANENIRDESSISQEMSDEESKAIINNINSATTEINEKYTPGQLMTNFSFLSSHSNSSDDDSNNLDEIITPTCNSKNLHARLTHATINEMSINEEKFHRLTVDKLKVFEDGTINKTEISFIPFNTSEKHSNNVLKDQGSTNALENVPLIEFPRTDTDTDTSLRSSRSKYPSNNDKKNDRISLQENSSQNSCNEFNNSNEESLTNESDLWTILRGQLKRVRENFNDSLYAPIVPVDSLIITNNYLSDVESGRLNSTESDELLHYFNAERNDDNFAKLSISENYNCHSQMSTTNGLTSKLTDNSGINNENISNLSKNKKENSINSDQGKDENISINLQRNSNETPELTLKQQSGRQELIAEMKTQNFNKQKLLAAMKAIDDNKNIEFTLKNKVKETNNSIRSQVTENLYRGLPTRVKKREEIIKDIFADTKIENKLQSRCSKIH